VGKIAPNSVIFLRSVFIFIIQHNFHAYMARQINNRNSGDVSKKKASTDYEIGDCLTADSNGFLVPGGSGTVKGICNEKISASDVSAADYASTRDLNFTGFKHDDQFEFPVITGTATQTLVGELVDIDATDPRGVDVTASTNNQVEVTRIIDASTIWGRFVVQTA